jgi:putative nucleotidyltransferase with HDIG domain
MPTHDPQGEASPPPADPAAGGVVKPEAGLPEATRQLVEMAKGRWSGRIANSFLLIVLAAASSYLLTPGIFAQRIPYGEESIGQFSSTVVKATRDYDIPDEETTRRKRDEAREAVLPVYDYDVTVAEAASERVQAAFAVMHQVARDVDARLKPKEGAEPRPSEDPKKRKKDDPAIAEQWTRAFEEKRELFQRKLETTLDDETFRALVEARFAEEVQREVEKSLVRAQGQMVAEYRDPLALSGGRGVAVRRRSGNEVLGEKLIADVAPIRDQTEVRHDSDRWAGDLPSEWTPALKKALLTMVARQVRANLRFNREETEERRRQSADTVKPVVIQLKKGEKIIGDGERIERRHVVIFNAIRSQAGGEENAFVRIGSGLFAALLVIAVYLFARASLPRFKPTRKDALLGALTILVMLGLINVSVTVSDALHDRFPRIAAEALYYATPFAAGAMLIRFVLSAEAAAVLSMVLAGLAGVLVGNSLEFGVYSLIGSLVASAHVARAKDRAALFRAGFFTGLANAAAALAFAMLSNKMTGWGTAASCLGGFVGGAIAVPILVMGVTPLVEATFGYTTDIKLLELANLNHPALKELIVQAPGTYHHSIIIGSLVEAAAEAIGANPLLARVCAYYHDIGKGKNPLYFGENQRGDNRHDKLAPQMSALIIKRHVTDGVEMARHYKLPRPVADAIPQHHGTRLVGYFFHKALKEAEGKPDAGPVEESLYRYAGPKPQFREAALVMIADAVEASSRAIQDPTPAKLQALVQKIINGIFADGQLDECDLTLRDLNEIARSFYRTLGGIYHTRPDYPPAAVAGGPRPALAEVKDGRVLSEATASKPEDPKPGSEVKKLQGV